MKHVHPSSSVATTDRSSIRHRSGTFSPTLGRAPGISSTSFKSLHQGLTVQVEDTDSVDSKPTILLVQRPGLTPRTPRSPILPFHAATSKNTLTRAYAAEFSDLPDPNEDPRSASPSLYSDEDASVTSPFRPAPLTPRSTPLGRRLLPKTKDSKTDLLPVPVTSCEPSPRSLPSRLLSWRAPPAERPHSALSRSNFFDPPPESLSSSASTASTASTVRASSTSVAFHYKRPLSSGNSNSKLTKKFPISASVHKLSALGRGKVGDHAFAIVLLDEAAGMGIDRIDRWTAHKWCLFLSVCTVFAYGAAGLAYAVLTWFGTWVNADVMLVADYDVLVLITIASSILCLTFLVGITGTILNSRPILAVYALLLWPAFISLLAIGYTSYKRSAFALDRKLNLAWSQWYTPYGRLVVQDALRCCGYYSPLHEATPSDQCYVRAMLPGCKGKLLRFERANLAAIWYAAFGLVPVHIANIVVALLCANHVTRRFGKGVMPRQYRLNGDDVRADEDRLFSALAKDGAGVLVRPALSRSPSSSVFREDKEDVGGDIHDGPPPALHTDSPILPYSPG